MIFPSNPTTGQQYKPSDNHPVYVWVDYAWKAVAKAEVTPDSGNKIRHNEDVFSEFPKGEVNDVNFRFFLNNHPIIKTLQVYLNGMIQRIENDYTVIDNQIYFIEPPYTDSIITCFYLYESHTQIFSETPIGVCNGINNTFMLEYIPSAENEMVFLNGLLQHNGNNSDYIVINDTILFALPPPTGSLVVVNYFTNSL